MDFEIPYIVRDASKVCRKSHYVKLILAMYEHD